MPNPDTYGRQTQPAGDAFPLSAPQRGMWFAQQLDPTVPVNIAQYVEIRGAIDVPLLLDSLVTAAHEIGTGFLRLVEIDGVPHQLVDHDLDTAVDVVDLRAEPDPLRAAADWMTADRSAPIDLYTDRLVRSAVLHVGVDHYYWYCRVHHVALDGMGASTMIDRCAELYTAAVTASEAAPFRPADLVELTRIDADYRASRRFAADRDYWAQQLGARDGEPTTLADRQAPPAAVSRVSHRRLPDSTLDHLDHATSRHGSSVSFETIAAVAAFLARVTGRDEVTLSLPVTARTTAVLRRSGGMVSNVVPLRIAVPADAVPADLVAAVRVAVTGALRHQRFPSVDMADGRTGIVTDGPLVNVMLFHNEVALGDVTGTLHVLSTGPVHDLAIDLYQGESDSLHLDLEANPALYDDAVLAAHHERLVEFVHRFLAAGAAADETPVGELAVLLRDETAQLVPAPGPVGPPPATLPVLLDRAVRLGGDGDALVTDGPDGPHTVSYRVLDDRSTRLARLLADHGVGPETPVALAIARSAESVTATWALARAGAPFVPVDPNYPADRIAYMLADCGASVGLTTSAQLPHLPATVGERPIEWIVLDDPATSAAADAYLATPVTDADRTGPVRLDSLAYVIYTSGSTGRPKGVAVSHRGLAALAADERRRLSVESSSRVLHFASPSFDASVFELLMATCAGATLVVAPPSVYGGTELADLLARHAVTHAFCTPAALATVDPAAVPALRTVLVAGDVCPPELVARWAPGRTMVNAYGPSETTVMASATAAMTPGAPVTIGAPTTGVALLVLDERLRPAAPGSRGELYVAGDALARGYVGRAGQTSERFVANPFGLGRLYRTGDVVRWVRLGDTDAAGAPGTGRPLESAWQLEFLGRSDHQIKIRGFRIEPGEVDTALLAATDVVAAHTLGHTDEHGVTRLVSYVIAGPHTDDRADTDLAAVVATRLPRHMVPSAIVRVPELPLTPAGKIDRAALPAPVFAAADADDTPPRTPVEATVADVLAEVLSVTRPGVHADFFALGGNSLLATQVVSRINAALGADLGVRDVFENPTVAGIAAAADAHTGSGASDAPTPELTRRENVARVPLSSAQQRIWLTNRLDPASPAYNLPLALTLDGPLDTDALQAALGDVLDRHEPLRTVCPADETGPYQHMLAVDDVAHTLTPVDTDAAGVARHTAALARTGFDLTTEQPLRAALLRVTPSRHVLALVVHHIAADGWSMAPLAADLMAAYEARLAGHPPRWEPLDVRYADYTLWQRDMLGGASAREFEYWTHTLDGVSGSVELPADRVRPQTPTHRAGTVEVSLDSELWADVTAAAQRHGVTPFMVVHAALAVLLHRSGAGEDVVIGTPVAGRGAAALDSLVGMFVNTLALRLRVRGGDTVASLLEQAREADLGAFGHADVPFDEVLDRIGLDRSALAHPLTQVMLFFQNTPPARLALAGLDVSADEIATDIAKNDLQVTVDSGRDLAAGVGAQVRWDYARDLFDRDTVAALADAFVTVLRAVATGEETRAVGDIAITGRDSEARWNATAHPVAATTLPDAFAASAARTPDACALSAPGAEPLTYRGFADRVHRLSRLLIERGIGPEDRVVVAMRRGIDLVVGMYAVVGAGAAYVPIDPDHPAERIAYVLDSAAPKCVLTTSGDAVEAGADVPSIEIDRIALDGYDAAPVTDVDRVAPLRPLHPAYVIYTSGSTGRPKGVAVPHEAIVNQLAWMQHEYPLAAGEVYLQKTATTFDVSVWGYFWPLQVGAHLLLAEPDGHRDPAALARAIDEYSVVATDFVPSMLDVFVAEAPAETCSSLRDVFVIGEALPAATAQRFGDRWHARLHNLYGPTEAAVSVTYWPADETPAEAATVPIGVAEWNVRTHVLDARLHPCAPGVPGE
ncbi:non-ribosomal peptide synthetase, partial [Rhodococcus sp. HNM0569]|uniref:non-ribosomal peptide synthetase n=1 Tax=Rhodococcus sp. HNM0569 TaxID=2716340 RepID=UPI00146ACC04|nr:amino acid adenylation domain-containing protein [Rhodococcus sp. HNM0569]